MHTFPQIAARLKRAHGHLAGVIEMLEQGRECMDIAQQQLNPRTHACNTTHNGHDGHGERSFEFRGVRSRNPKWLNKALWRDTR